MSSVNQVVPASEVISTAIAVANEINKNSPDAIQATKRGLLLSQENGHSQMLLAHAFASECRGVYKGDNIKVSGLLLIHFWVCVPSDQCCGRLLPYAATSFRHCAARQVRAGTHSHRRLSFLFSF